MLYDKTPGFNVSVDWRVAVTIAVATGLFFVFALGMALRGKGNQPTTGREGMIGEKGIAMTAIDPEGDIKIHGEIWKAFSDEKIRKGDKIKVIAVDGLELKIGKINNLKS